MSREFDLIYADQGQTLYPAVVGSVRAKSGLVTFTPGVGDKPRRAVGVPLARVHEILYRRPLPEQQPQNVRSLERERPADWGAG